MKSIELERIALRECGKPKRRQIDREGITRRWERGYTQQEIADAVKCSTATVRKVLRQEGYEEVFSGSWGSCKVMRRERIMEIIERPDEEQKEHESAIFQMGEAWRENKMNFPINIENLGDLTPQERDEAIFRLGAEYGARAMAERFLQDLDASMKMKESDGKE